MSSNQHARKQSLTKREPAVAIGAVSALVAAILGLLTAFGVDLTEEQTAAILGVIAAAGPVVTGLLIRRKVTPSASARKDVP